ncbi:MAG: hypothetical protein H0X12_00020 [Nocardioides sp.]|nr:hypothetical protein [Nocardioides sp.]
MASELSYATYLKVEDLLSLQVPRSAGVEEDRTTMLSEHFFIVSHQTCELWLKQILADLAAVEDAFQTMATGDLERSVDLLYRASDLLRLLHEQLLTLERLPLEDFVKFRQHLGTASGAQSSQFHLLEGVIGNARRDGGLFKAFAAGLERTGVDLETVVWAGVEAGSTHRVIEGMLAVGNGYFRWKIGHVGLISKMLGEQQGTAGTSGVAYLMDRATLPFALLRELRGSVHRGPGPQGAL